MKIMITGVAGFVGSTLARKFIQLNSEIKVVGIDNYSFSDESRIKDILDNIDFYEIDVKDMKKNIELFGLKDIDLIIHCAAIAPLPDNQENPYRSIEQNVAVCAAVSDYATIIGCKDIIFFSSGAVYEGSGSKACKESDLINTKLIYPTSKYLAERYFNAVSSTYGLRVVAIRLFNLYGPCQDYLRKQPPLIGYLIKSYLAKENITLYADKNSKRDYIYIDDLFNLVHCIINKISSLEDGVFLTVNAGSEKVYSVFDIVEELEEVVGKELNYEIGNKAEFWNKYSSIFDRALPLKTKYLAEEVDKISIANIDFAREYFGWSPKFDMKHGLNECLEFAKEVLK